MTFYKRDGDTLLEAPTTVIGPGYELYAENHSEYTYPVEGWYWFDSIDDVPVEMKPIETEDLTPLQSAAV